MDEESGQRAVVFLCRRRANSPESSEEEQQRLDIVHHAVDAPAGGVCAQAEVANRGGQYHMMH